MSSSDRRGQAVGVRATVVDGGHDGDDRHAVVDEGHAITHSQVFVTIEASSCTTGRRSTIVSNSTGISAFGISVANRQLSAVSGGARRADEVEVFGRWTR